MSHRKRIYLAGAMGCYGEDPYPYTWRNKVKQFFIYHSDNFEIFSPIDYYNYQNTNHKSEKEIMLYELNALQDSKIMLVNLKDLDKSIGTSDEILLHILIESLLLDFMKMKTYLTFTLGKLNKLIESKLAKTLCRMLWIIL